MENSDEIEVRVMGYSEAKEWQDAAVYQLHVGDEVYVGSTGNLKRRLRRHETDLKRGCHHNPKLQAAYLKERLVVVEAEATSSKCEALSLEQLYVDTLPKDKILNVCFTVRGGNGNDISGVNNPNFGKFGELNPFFGKKHSVETRQAMSDTRSGSKNPAFGRVGKAHPLSKPVMVNGVRYESCGEAARALGISEGTIRGRVKSTNPKHAGYFKIVDGDQ